jgi:hypothetical protein
MITFKKLENGNLRLSATKGHKRELRQYWKEHGEIDALVEATEHYWANGWGVYPDGVVGYLTNAPIICDDVTIDEDGNPISFGKTWWYPNYQIKDCIEEMLKNEFVDFKLASNGEK